ncbi:hypothetical protein EUX98_g9788 [Antrodiella citrinella]|uniref:Uncharacterized protein n=1 Tax=Antrodiella citrinella TaxID=2447956 RepID=A0A4S4LRL2_9APHY|nr:hypothetical protein EUX98_g9788 [Antrodiella citrinella]
MQKALAAEKTPTLSRVLPAYETLIHTLRNMAAYHFPKLSHAILAAADKIDKYLAILRKTRMYVLAMVINPTVKLQWLEENWAASEITEAKRWLEEAMMQYQAASHPTTASSQSKSQANARASFSSTPLSSSAQATMSQTSAFNHLEDFMDFYLKRLATAPLAPAPVSGPSTGTSEPTETEDE